MSLDNKIIILATEGDTANITYNYLSQTARIDQVLFEQPVSRKKFLSRRIKRLGFFQVVGQVMFQVLIPIALKGSAKTRIKELMQKHNLDMALISRDIVTHVNSVNSKTCIELLKEANPSLVVVNGTRIISQKVLDSVDCPFVNMHAGITPHYRGVHGGYWALVNEEKERCGVTVHLVDKGIDTGNILKQTTIEPTAEDNFLTYPYLQLAAGLKLLSGLIDPLLSGEYVAVNSSEKGKLWHHPTLWTYIRNRIRLGVK